MFELVLQFGHQVEGAFILDVDYIDLAQVQVLRVLRMVQLVLVKVSFKREGVVIIGGEHFESFRVDVVFFGGQGVPLIFVIIELDLLLLGRV